MPLGYLNSYHKCIIGYSPFEESYGVFPSAGLNYFRSTLEDAETVIANILGEEIESLGLLDKRIYSRKVQDAMGIE